MPQPLSSPFGNGPQNLGSPVPNVDEAQAAESLPPMDVPEAPGGMAAAPGAMRAEPESEFQMPSEEELLANAQPSEFEQTAASAAGVSPYIGKAVTGKIFGNKHRVNPSGTVEYFDTKKKKWSPLTPGMVEAFKGAYNVKKSLPGVLGSVAGGFVPGGPLARVAGSAAGAALGEMAGAVDLSKESKEDYLIRMAAGASDESASEARPGMAALIGGAAQLGGEAIGGVLRNAQTKAMDQRQVLQGLDALAAPRAELADTAKRYGVEMPGLQMIKDLPGSELVSKQEYNLLAGVANPEERAKLQQFYVKQQAQLRDGMNKHLADIAPNVDFGNLDITKVVSPSANRPSLNLGGRIRETYQQRVGLNRAMVSDLAKGKEIDPSPLLSQFEGALRETFPNDATLFEVNGAINLQKFKKLLAQEGYSDEAMKSLGDLYFTLKNAQKRVTVSHPYRAQMEATGNNLNLDPTAASMMLNKQTVSEDLKGLSFDQLARFVDTIQDMAAFNKAERTPFQRKIGDIANQARALEDDVTANLFANAGRAKEAMAVIDAKDQYVRNIGAIKNLEDLIAKNPDNAADVIFQMAPHDFNKTLSLLSENQLKELRGSVIMSSLADAMGPAVSAGETRSISGAKLMAKLLSDKQTEQKLGVLLGDHMTDLKGLIGLAAIAENRSLGGAAEKQVANKSSKFAMRVLPWLGGKAMSVVRSLFYKSPKVAELIERDFAAVMEASAKRQAMLAKRASAFQKAEKANKYLVTPFMKGPKATIDLMFNPASLGAAMQGASDVNVEDLKFPE